MGIVLAIVMSACSSSSEKVSQGSLAVTLSASHPADPVSMSGISSGQITISELEAHRAGGAWVPFENSTSPAIDVVALANGGGGVTLSSSLLPEGQYDALQVRIAQVVITTENGTPATIAPPGTGWGLVLPVDIAVVSGRETTVSLNVRVERAFKHGNGQLEFEPEFEIGGVAHD